MRPVIAQLEASKIREIANAGMGRKDVLAFWFGESDEVTPDVIRNAAIESLQSGETFYAQNCGLPELREALAQYTRESHPSADVDANRIVVTSGGVSALMLAVQALVDAGDEAVIITPSGPTWLRNPPSWERRCAACHCSRRAVPGVWTCLGCSRPSPSARGC